MPAAEDSSAISGDGAPVAVETAYAKLNLTLEVLRRREDGYHEIASLMQTIGLRDKVTITESDRLEVVCSDASLSGEGNLVHRAALELAHEAGVEPRVKVEVQKRIPVAAGLGGGSADAAATLRGLNRLWRLGMPNDDLSTVASRLGSDVPFLLAGGTALATGTGTDVEWLPDAGMDRIVLAVPTASDADSIPTDSMKTAAMYGALSPMMFTNGSLSRRLGARVRQGGDCHPGFMFNVFQRLASSVWANWTETHDALMRLGAKEVFLSGSGPAMFTFAPNRETGTLWATLLPLRSQCVAFAVDAVGQVPAS